MSKICFKEKRFGPDALARIVECNRIISRYEEMGLRLTLRQLYYQFVSADLIENTERSYKGLGKLVSEARLAGLIDWDAIEDRVRQPKSAPEWGSVADLVKSALRSYRLPRWEGQACGVELWVEKDALAGVLWPIAHKYHVTLMVNRGYSSTSAMYESAQRFEEMVDKGQEPWLLYLGDHDPSGEDMTRDIEDRLMMFGQNVNVRKIALTMEQIKKYKPPPNPAKMSDSRASAYVAKHGHQSWEVDALPPDVLTRLIESELESLMDADMVEAIKRREESDKRKLTAAAAKL